MNKKEWFKRCMHFWSIQMYVFGLPVIWIVPVYNSLTSVCCDTPSTSALCVFLSAIGWHVEIGIVGYTSRRCCTRCSCILGDEYEVFVVVYIRLEYGYLLWRMVLCCSVLVVCWIGIQSVGILLHAAWVSVHSEIDLQYLIVIQLIYWSIPLCLNN